MGTLTKTQAPVIKASAKKTKVAKVKSLVKTLKEKGYTEKIHQIRMLAAKGIERKDAIAAGFNKNTVHRQYREYLNS